MAQQRRPLAERLEQAARHLRLVGDALGRLSAKDVWFVVSPTALRYYNPPIGQDACYAAGGGQPARISVEGLNLIVEESVSTVVQARKALGRRSPARGASKKRARRR